MEEPNDPGSVGVKAGRVVGFLTAIIAVVTLVSSQSALSAVTRALLSVFEIEAAVYVRVWFWVTVIVAVLTRYSLGYVVGSLIGVLYDWINRPNLPDLVAIVVFIGLVDGGLAFFDTFNLAIASAYVLAWLCYVPVFVWLVDDEANSSSKPRRLGET